MPGYGRSPAGRRGSGNRAMECPCNSRGSRSRLASRLRQYRRAQSLRNLSANTLSDRRDHARRRFSGWRSQCGHERAGRRGGSRGKASLVVLDDADLDEAVKAAAFGAFMNQGQICMSTERIVVDDSVGDAFVEKLANKANSLV